MNMNCGYTDAFTVDNENVSIKQNTRYKNNPVVNCIPTGKTFNYNLKIKRNGTIDPAIFTLGFYWVNPRNNNPSHDLFNYYKRYLEESGRFHRAIWSNQFAL